MQKDDKIGLMKKLFLVLFFGFCCAPALGAESLSQINDQIKKTEAQQKQLEQQVKTSERDLEKTKSQLVRAADKVSELEDQRGAMTRKISELDKQRDALVAKMDNNRAHISDAAATILFVASHPGFDSQNMREYVLTSAILSGAAQNFESEIQQADAQVKQLEAIISQRATEKEKLDRTAKKYATEKTELDKLLKTRSDQNKKLRGQQTAVNKKLQDLSEQAKNISELSRGVGSSDMSADSSFTRRKLNPPVRGSLRVRFMEKTALGLQTDGWHIRTRGAAIVVAPADGVVKFADKFRGFGQIIIMSHKNGYNTVMTNLGELSVMVGQELLAGEPLGRMDSGKDEMYLEVRRGDRAVDPARLFKEP